MRDLFDMLRLKVCAKLRKGAKRKRVIIFQKFKARLGELGYPFVSAGDEIRFKNSKRAQLYYLVFASRHEKGHEFWKKIQVIDPRGQRQMFT